MDMLHELDNIANEL